jgi:glutamine---fructose-6-phosphate transaminase (isomerizing)
VIDGITIASDLMALVGYSDTYYPLEDKTFLVARRDDVRVFNLNHDHLQQPNFKKIELDHADTEKGVNMLILC